MDTEEREELVDTEKRKVSMIPWIIGFVIALFMYFACGSIISGIISIFTAGIYVTATEYNHRGASKALIYSIFLYLLCEIYIFPFTYLITINNNPKSFIIDSEILNHELLDAQQEFFTQNNPKAIKNELNITNIMLHSKSEQLNSSLEKLLSNDIIYVDSFLLYRSIINNRLRHKGSNLLNAIAVCNMDGVNIGIISCEEVPVFDKKITIKEFLAKSKATYQKKNEEVDQKLKRIKEHQIWTYNRILFYSLNNINTKSIKPTTRLANFIDLIHNVFVGIILFSIITSSIFKIIESNRK